MVGNLLAWHYFRLARDPPEIVGTISPSLQIFFLTLTLRYPRQSEKLAGIAWSVKEKAMTYTVKQVAAVSGVTVRTLHFYDEMALLKPAYSKANGYRIYEEQQLLVLQQILFYRELGFELKRIK